MISTRSSTRASLSLVVASSHATRRVVNRALASSAIDQNCREKITADTLLCGRGVDASARKNVSAGPSASTGPSYNTTFFDSASVGRHASRRWRSSVVKISDGSQNSGAGRGGTLRCIKAQEKNIYIRVTIELVDQELVHTAHEHGILSAHEQKTKKRMQCASVNHEKNKTAHSKRLPLGAYLGGVL